MLAASVVAAVAWLQTKPRRTGIASALAATISRAFLIGQVGGKAGALANAPLAELEVGGSGVARRRV